MWVLVALIGAFFTGLTAIFMKVGTERVDSNLGFAIQSILIVILSWVIVGFQGQMHKITSIEPKSWAFLALSAVSTTCAYLFYFRALSMGDPAQVAPVDRLSLVFTVIMTALFLRERISGQIVVGATLMAIGAIIVATARQPQ